LAELAEPIAPVAFGQVESISGSGALEMCRGGCESIRSGASVSVGAGLATDAVARVALRLEDGSRLWVDAQTRMQVVAPSVVRLEAGRMLVETKTHVRVETPAGEVEVAAGAVSVRSEAAEGSAPARTRISVLSGDASLRGAREVTPLAAGESAMVEGGEVKVHPSASLAYQTAWARDMRVEAEIDEGQDAAPRGVGNIYGKDPRTKQELPEALSIKRLSVHATIHERVARTEIEQVITNTTRQTLEGYYTFPLPPDASIVRFAMEINGQLMEGEIVERGRAVQIFDQIVADYIRPRDPALLEWKGGNTFQIRIFPMFGGKDARVILWYTQALAADGVESRYVYPLPRTGKVAIDAFAFSADVEADQPLRSVGTPMYASSVEQGTGSASNTATVRFDKEHFSPRQDLVMEWEVPQFTRATPFVGAGLEAGESPFFMLVLQPNIQGKIDEAPRGGRPHVFVMDTSSGVAEGDLKAEVAAITAYMADLGPDDTFTVLAADQGLRPFDRALRPATSESVQEAIAFMEGQRPAGASWLEGMFVEAGKLLGGVGSARPVIVYVGDGRATIGETRHEQLVDAIDGAVGATHPEIDAIGIGSDVNVALLERLTRRFGGSLDVINRGEDVPRRVAGMAQSSQRPSLRQATLNFSSDNVELVYPTQLPTVRQGEEVVVVGRFKGTVDGQVTLTGLVGDEPYAQPFRVALTAQAARQGSFVPRIWAQRHIEHLSLYGGAEARDEIVRVSQRHTVMSRFTSFLVLESERMYQQYKIDRQQNQAYKSLESAQARGDAAGADKPTDVAEEEVPSDEAARDFGDKEPRNAAAPSREVIDSLFKEGDAEAPTPTEPSSATEWANADDGDDTGGDTLDRGRVTGGLGSRGRDSGAELDSAGVGQGGGGKNRGDGGLLPMAKDEKPEATKVVGGSVAGPKRDASDREAAGGGESRKAGKDVLVDDKANLTPKTGGEGSFDGVPPRMPDHSLKERPKAEPGPRPDPSSPRKPSAQDGKKQDTFVAPRGPRASIRSLAAQPSGDDSPALAGLLRQIADEPLRRDHRRRLVRYHLVRGDAASAAEAARGWVEQDGAHAEAHWRYADLLARTGELERAEEEFGAAIELAPQDKTAMARWARHLALRDEVALSAAVHQALFATTGSADDMLDLVLALARVDVKQARDVLAAGRARFSRSLDRGQQRRADDLAALIDAGGMAPGELRPSGKLDLGGAGSVVLSWEGTADLDISVVLPNGERISPDMPMSIVGDGKRGYMAAESARGHVQGSNARTPLEAVVMPWAPPGQYRIEVIRRSAVDQAVEAWVTVRFLGTSRTFRATVPPGDRDVRVADVQVVAY